MRHLHVHVFVQFGSKMAWHLTTAIEVSVILRDVVNIMEDQAVPVQVFHGLQESHVKQHGSVKGLGPTLNTFTYTHKHIHPMSQRAWCCYLKKYLNTVKPCLMSKRISNFTHRAHSMSFEKFNLA